MGLKLFKVLSDNSRKKDDAPTERLEINRVRITIEEQCNKYIHSSDDIYRFEAYPDVIDATLAVLESKSFQEKYEFAQESESIFLIRLRELDIL